MVYSVQYYDLVLAAVLASVVGATVGYLTAVSAVSSIVLACAIAAAVIYHAIFVNGPVEGVDDLTEEVDRLGPIDLPD